MAIYRYLVTVETNTGPAFHTERDDIRNEIDSNLESVIVDLGIEHFTVEPIDLVEPDYRERVIRSHES